MQILGHWYGPPAFVEIPLGKSQSFGVSGDGWLKAELCISLSESNPSLVRENPTGCCHTGFHSGLWERKSLWFFFSLRVGQHEHCGLLFEEQDFLSRYNKDTIEKPVEAAGKNVYGLTCSQLGVRGTYRSPADPFRWRQSHSFLKPDHFFLVVQWL